MPNNSRTADKFVVRMRPGQRDRVIERAKTEHRAMNDVCTVALDRYLDQQQAFEQVLATLQGCAMVPKAELQELHQLVRLTIGGDIAQALALANNISERMVMK